ncbi:unnamed protein product [Lampetra planeri]
MHPGAGGGASRLCSTGPVQTGQVATPAFSSSSGAAVECAGGAAARALQLHLGPTPGAEEGAADRRPRRASRAQGARRCLVTQVTLESEDSLSLSRILTSAHTNKPQTPLARARLALPALAALTRSLDM